MPKNHRRVRDNTIIAETTRCDATDWAPSIPGRSSSADPRRRAKPEAEDVRKAEKEVCISHARCSHEDATQNAARARESSIDTSFKSLSDEERLLSRTTRADGPVSPDSTNRKNPRPSAIRLP